MDETRNAMDNVRFPNIPLKPSIIPPPTTQQALSYLGFKLPSLQIYFQIRQQILTIASLLLLPSNLGRTGNLEDQIKLTILKHLCWARVQTCESCLIETESSSQVWPKQSWFSNLSKGNIGQKLKAQQSVLVLFQIRRSLIFPWTNFLPFDTWLRGVPSHFLFTSKSFSLWTPSTGKVSHTLKISKVGFARLKQLVVMVSNGHCPWWSWWSGWTWRP